MVTGGPFAVYRDGAAHDYAYVDDVVDAPLCGPAPPPGNTGTHNIGSGRYVSLTEIHGLMSAVLDGAPPPSPNEDSCDELNAIVLNATKAAKELGWRPKVGIAEGIRRAIQWLCATLEPEARARRRRPDPYQLYLSVRWRLERDTIRGRPSGDLPRNSAAAADSGPSAAGAVAAVHSTDGREGCGCGLFYGDRLGQVAGFIDVVALGLGQRGREYLQWNRRKQRLEKH
jgi:hypothetical protein